MKKTQQPKKSFLTPEQQAVYPTIFENLWQPLHDAAQKQYDAFCAKGNFTDRNDVQHAAAVNFITVQFMAERKNGENVEWLETNPRVMLSKKYLGTASMVQSSLESHRNQAANWPNEWINVTMEEAENTILQFAKDVHQRGITRVIEAIAPPAPKRTGDPAVQVSASPGVTKDEKQL